MTRTLIQTLAAPVRALGDLAVLLSSAGPRIEAIERLSTTSDAALAARGTTRADEIRRLVGVRAAA